MLFGCFAFHGVTFTAWHFVVVPCFCDRVSVGFAICFYGEAFVDFRSGTFRLCSVCYLTEMVYGSSREENLLGYALLIYGLGIFSYFCLYLLFLENILATLC